MERSLKYSRAWPEDGLGKHTDHRWDNNAGRFLITVIQVQRRLDLDCTGGKQWS